MWFTAPFTVPHVLHVTAAPPPPAAAAAAARHTYTQIIQ